MQHSQLAPLPIDVPFQLVSKTIGQGAYACIKKAIMPEQPANVFAVKFINKDYAQRKGRVNMQQLNLEISLHSQLGHHPHIVQFFMYGENVDWKWIAMELAEGGDLFDKIESDVGVGENVAHLYFTQLVSAVSFMHSRGIGHRDLKPENILLSATGDLKIADFGLASKFEHNGVRKISKTSCGSPPYTSPEVMTGEKGGLAQASGSKGYYPDLVDIWSCGIVLFVLMVGNTPWDEPTERSYEFHEYANLQNDAIPEDELWHRLPKAALPLLKGLMQIDPTKRWSFQQVQSDPWFRRSNPHLAAGGTIADPINLATEMFKSLKVNLDMDPKMAISQSQSQQSRGDVDMDMGDQTRDSNILPASPLETPTAELTFDWDKPSASQLSYNNASQSLDMMFADEPSLSQFTQVPTVPLSRTQYARQFGDILPSHSLTRFISIWSLRETVQHLHRAFEELGVREMSGRKLVVDSSSELAQITILSKGLREQVKGDVVVEAMHDAGCSVVFIKHKGDPIEWRRLFKQCVVLCREGVYIPN